MHEQHILTNLMAISHDPFLIFANRVEGKPDNTLAALKFLREREDATAGQLSEYLDIKPSSVTQIIKKLEESGTAARVKSPTDARVTLVKITDKGRESLATKGELNLGLREELFKGFTADELTQFADYLTRLRDRLASDAFTQQVNEMFADDHHWQRMSQMSGEMKRAREQFFDHENHRRGPGRRGFGPMGGEFDHRRGEGPGFDEGRRGFKR